MTLYSGLKIVYSWTNCVYFTGLGSWKWTYVLYFSFVCILPYRLPPYKISGPKDYNLFSGFINAPMSSNILLDRRPGISPKHLWFPALGLVFYSSQWETWNLVLTLDQCTVCQWPRAVSMEAWQQMHIHDSYVPKQDIWVIKWRIFR